MKKVSKLVMFCLCGYMPLYMSGFALAETLGELERDEVAYCHGDSFAVSLYAEVGRGIGAVDVAEVSQVIGGDITRVIARLKCFRETSSRSAANGGKNGTVFKCFEDPNSTRLKSYTLSLHENSDSTLHSVLSRIDIDRNRPLDVKSTRLAYLSCQLQ